MTSYKYYEKWRNANTMERAIVVGEFLYLKFIFVVNLNAKSIGMYIELKSFLPCELFNLNKNVSSGDQRK